MFSALMQQSKVYMLVVALSRYFVASCDDLADDNQAASSIEGLKAKVQADIDMIKEVQRMTGAGP